jgi:hypothetical protein
MPGTPPGISQHRKDNVTLNERIKKLLNLAAHNPAEIESIMELVAADAVIQHIKAQENGQDEEAARRKAVATMDSAHKIEKRLFNASIHQQIEEAARIAGGINPPLIAEFAMKKAKVESTVDGTGAFLDGWPIKTYIEKMALLSETAHLFASDAETPAPAKESKASQDEYRGDNPFVKGPNWNLTRQGQLVRDNPTLAARLREAAQVKEQPPADSNPWKAGSVNLTRQCQLVRQNPDKARSMIKEAGKDPALYGLK